MGNNTSAVSPKDSYPTLHFNRPPPNADGSDSVCARCLTLFMHAAEIFGDGTGNDGLEIPHTRSIRDLSPACVVCKKMMILFDVARDHISFEDTLRTSPTKDWSLAWRVDSTATVPKVGPEHTWRRHDRLPVSIMARHKRGYSWGIGGFKLYADNSAQGQRNESEAVESEESKNARDSPIITSLSPSTNRSGSGNDDVLDFSSTIGSGPLSLIETWSQKCVNTHTNCNYIFARDGLEKPAEPWFPDRLVKLTTTSDVRAIPASQAAQISARIVEKTDLADFPTSQLPDQLQYLSLSHCWGKPPSKDKYKYCLTKEKLPDWKRRLPVDSLARTFRDAIQVCALLRVEYIWIDSLCIMQDIPDDWHIQGAQMDSVYKHAWLNIAALVSLSDQEGFLNHDRDTRVGYGFRLPFAQIFGFSVDQRDSNGRRCSFLRGETVLVWNTAENLRGSWAGNAPLFDRAWVYQERNMSRRTLGFTKEGIIWACDGFRHSEFPGGGSIFEEAQLRHTLQGARDAAVESRALRSTATPEQADAELGRRALQLVESFDTRWSASVAAYTQCKLTYQTDKLMAFSAVAREYANSGLTMKARYLAGLWDFQLQFQIGWITVEGKTTPRRIGVGEKGYTAPSWSWASIEAPAQPRNIFMKDSIALADVIGADVVLKKDYNKFGPVTAGWLRLRGHLNQVKGLGWTSPLRLTDTATGEDMWFSPDTVEGYNTWSWRRSLDKLVWVPLRLDFTHTSISGSCLVLAAVDDYSGGDSFVKPGERIFRRLGTGNFGHHLDGLHSHALLLGLGTYPEVDATHDTGPKIKPEFRRKEEGFTEFVII